MTSLLTMAGSALSCSVDPHHGARLSSLIVNNHELLVQPGVDTSPMGWGAYPMAPWAGRVRNGVFAHNGVSHRLHRNKDPHAIHGTVFDVPWNIIETGAHNMVLTAQLGEHWPLGGQVEHRISVFYNIVECRLTVVADVQSMPVQVGWHPWFVRPVTLTSSFSKMFLRDTTGIPTGHTVTPTPPPWDDCFTDARTSPVLNFANGVTVTVESDCDYWVIYDEPDHAICVEPQSGPPDGFTLAPHVIKPHESFTRYMRLRIS